MNRILLIILVFFVGLSYGQDELGAKKAFNEGIEAYQKGHYSAATEHFERASTLNPSYSKAYYNAANAYYRNNDLESANINYQRYIESLEGKERKAKGLYNLGNTHVKHFLTTKQKDPKQQGELDILKNGIEAYKQSLRLNPEDKNTRYNLSYAMRLLPPPSQQEDSDDKGENGEEGDPNQEGEKQQNDNKGDGDESKDQNKEGQGDDNKEGNKDGQEKESDQNKGDQKEQDKQGGKSDSQEDKSQGKDNKGGQQNPQEQGEQEGKMTKAQISKDLDAINSDEKKILEAIARKKGKEKTKSNDKDW